MIASSVRKERMPREMLKRWFGLQPRLTVDTAQLPPGLRVYAVGDVHGRVDLLRSLHTMIADDAARAVPRTRMLADFLGD